MRGDVLACVQGRASGGAPVWVFFSAVWPDLPDKSPEAGIGVGPTPLQAFVALAASAAEACKAAARRHKDQLRAEAARWN